MKRLHIHITVEDLAANITFYSKLFGQEPTKEKESYAKWMLHDPYINFAISSKGLTSGVNHLGLQVDSTEELAKIKDLAEMASAGSTYEQHEVTCCHSKSEKHWTIDPQGIAWEHFVTLSASETFGDETSASSEACCIPLNSADQTSTQSTASCCIPNTKYTDSVQCCD